MKKSFSVTVVTLLSITLIFCIYNFFQNKKVSIACIDTIKILNSSNEMKEILAEYDVKEKNLKSQEDTIINEFKSEIQNFEKNKDKLSDKEKKDFTDKINNKESQYSRYKSINSKKLEEQKFSATQKILNKVNQITAKYAKDKGLTLVLGANGNGNIVYLHEAIDITEDIIKILNND